jgi:hypothetical protein
VSDTQARLAHERDYIARTIATVRNHKDADNCWPQWANIFADQIESLEAELERVTATNTKLINALVGLKFVTDCWCDLSDDHDYGCRAAQAALTVAARADAVTPHRDVEVSTETQLAAQEDK